MKDLKLFVVVMLAVVAVFTFGTLEGQYLKGIEGGGIVLPIQMGLGCIIMMMSLVCIERGEKLSLSCLYSGAALLVASAVSVLCF
jgi:hypothetical protein